MAQTKRTLTKKVFSLAALAFIARGVYWPVRAAIVIWLTIVCVVAIQEGVQSDLIVAAMAWGLYRALVTEYHDFVLWLAKIAKEKIR